MRRHQDSTHDSAIRACHLFPPGHRTCALCLLFVLYRLAPVVGLAAAGAAGGKTEGPACRSYIAGARTRELEATVMQKKAMFVLFPMVAVLAPMAYYSSPEWWPKIAASLSSATPSQDSASLVEYVPPTYADRASPSAPGGIPGSLEGTPVDDLSEVLRFDLTPGWVVNRWPRVSAGLAHLQLQGYRVPLVTGTAEDDLAGALTYYFNPRQQVQRITFYGTTGNTRKLVDLVTTRFGFARRLTNDASVFVFEIPGSNGQAISSLWVRPAKVIKTSDPRRRFEVALVIERPPGQ